MKTVDLDIHVQTKISLSEHPFTTAYIDIDNARLDWFIKKYGLTD